MGDGQLVEEEDFTDEVHGGGVSVGPGVVEDVFEGALAILFGDGGDEVGDTGDAVEIEDGLELVHLGLGEVRGEGTIRRPMLARGRAGCTRIPLLGADYAGGGGVGVACGVVGTRFCGSYCWGKDIFRPFGQTANT